MTVAELIAALQKMPQDAPVIAYFSHPDGHSHVEPDDVTYHPGSVLFERGVWIAP